MPGCERCAKLGKSRSITDVNRGRKTKFIVILCGDCWRALEDLDARAWEWFRDHCYVPRKQLNAREHALRRWARDLVPNKKNWRRHPLAQADALRGLLGEIGYAYVTTRLAHSLSVWDRASRDFPDSAAL
jgi:hypothetical protein